MTRKSSTVGKAKQQTGRKEKTQPSSEDAQVESIRQLGWTGQHAAAIDSATQALATPKIKPAEQMSLLDLRAESYIAIGKLDLAMKDAKAMMKLGKTAVLKAQALNRLAFVQMRMGDLQAAVKSATTAVKTAKTTRDSALLALSFYRLAEAQFRSGENETAAETAQKAIPLFEAAGDLSGAGRAYWTLAIAALNIGNADVSRPAAFKSLELCQQAGDQYGIGNALNVISFTDIDLVENMQHVQQALQAFESAGYIERRAAVTGNLSNIYGELGLNPHARRLYSEGVEIARRIGAKISLSITLGNLISTELILGLHESALSRVEEYKQVITALGDPGSKSTFETISAEFAMAKGDPRSAVRHYKAALKIDHESGSGKEIDNLALFGSLHIANGDPAAALKVTQKAVDLYRSGVFTQQSFIIWWRYAQALTANKKTKEASQALEQAYDLLLERVANVRDEGYRRNFLNKVEDNRELLQHWVKDGVKRKRPKERIYAHLAVETNIREPFKRLADTGLRLNALKTVSEIQTFLVEHATELSGGERVLLILEKDGARQVTESILPLPSYQSGKGYETAEDPKDVLKRIGRFLDQAHQTRTVQLTLPKKSGLNRIVAPLIAQNQVIGYLYVDMDSLYGFFDDTDRDMLGMLANQGAVALDNAGLLEGLERKVEERTEQLQERVNELQIINAIQQGLAAELDFQSIIDLVGDKLSKIFKTGDLGISWYDEKTNLMHYLYEYEHGERLSIPPQPPSKGGQFEMMRKTRQPIVANTVDLLKKSLGKVLPGTDMSKSIISVPIISSDRILGIITMENYERENAYGESELRLLTTIAASLGTALENARLFDETQRLLKITEERNAELAIINSVQAALAAELNIQGIYDAVGDKIREIFRNTDMDIRIYDPETNLMHYPYAYEGGERLSLEPNPVSEKGFEAHVLRSRQTLVINENLAEVVRQYGATLIPGTQWEKSAVYVPLIAGDQARGLIAMVNMQHEHAFSESDVRLLQTLANSMSVALENARLFNETQQRNAELAIINSVQQALAAELNIQGIYDAVGDKIREIFSNKDVGIRVYDPQTGLISFPYLYESGERVEVDPFPMAEKGFAAHVMRTGEPVVINANMEEEEKKYGSYTIPGTRSEKSLVMVPLFGGDQRRGAIDISDYEKEYAFTASDVRLLQTLANSMSVALENARLFAETQRLLKESNTLAEVGREISSSLDAKVVLENIVSYAMNLLGGDLSALFTPEEDGAIFRAIAAVGEHAEQIRNETIRTGAGILGDIAEKKKAEIVNNAEKDPRTLVVTGTEESSHEHMLVVPLMANEDLKGLMAVWRTGKDKDFTENELTFITSLSRQAVIALRNSQLYKEAQELRIAAEHANTAKSTFMANMSHELRTPLNAIIGFTRIVRRKAEGVLPEKQTENLDKVLSSGEHLLGLINTVLDIAKIEAGRMDVQALNFNVSSLVDQCANLATPLLKPTVSLKKQVGDEVGMIYSDQEKIKQIVLNLLSNAAKFTHAGKVTLSAWQADATLHISVADSGIGITEEALDSIFEEFQQADTSTTRQYGGTGLGLSISRNLARLLGGDLTATSEYGKGSIFTLTIPVKYGTKTASISNVEAGAPHQTESTLEAGETRKLVLVIDDDPDADYLLQENLNRNEFEVIGARNGHDGLLIARERQPHAILLDILMPETDGWQVLHDLKADAATKDIPVVLLTIVDKKALGFRLGASAYLLKPLKPDEVLNALRQVIKPKPDELIHVLAVDDDPHIADMLRQQLPESEFSVESALDGEAGLAAIEARLPDVLLLDIMMPKLDGFGVLENIRKNPATRDLPVIVISAKELTSEESARLTESVAFIMRKQGFDGVKLAREIKHSLAAGA